MTNHLSVPNATLPNQRPPRDEAAGVPGELANLESTYTIEDRSATLDFIHQHGLQDLLLQAREPLAAAFGAEATKVLQLVSDPDDGSASLYCLVLVPGDADAALEARRTFE